MSELTEITETAQDAVIEAVESKEVGEEEPRWHRQVALTTMIMALLAAFAGLLSGVTANEALLERTREIIAVSHLEGDRAFVETLKSKHEILTALGETPDQGEIERVAAFEEKMRELEATTAREEALVLTVTNAHLVFATAVTLLSLGITMGGMAVVIERKLLWTAGLVIGAVGAVCVGMGVFTMLS
jgi:hypothetical protein